MFTVTTGIISIAMHGKLRYHHKAVSSFLSLVLFVCYVFVCWLVDFCCLFCFVCCFLSVTLDVVL